MSNVKPGDLAMVVGAPPPWAGATCTVLRHAALDEVAPNLHRYGALWWLVEMARPMPCWNSRGPHLSAQCVMPDGMLRKIGGPDIEVIEVLMHEQVA